MKKQLAVLPFFPGFYDSILDSFIDQEVEMRMEDDDLTYEQVETMMDMKTCVVEMSKAWVESFNEATGLHLTIESVNSPKEYNFTTDRVFVEVTREDMKVLGPIRKTDLFKELLKDNFTSRDGFMSFYSNDPEDEEWTKPVKEWDHNQVSILIAAKVLTDFEDREEFLEHMYEESNVYESAQHIWKYEPELTPV